VSVSQFPITDIDPFSTAYLSDPYPHHRALRELGPVVWLNKYSVWCVTRHKETFAVLANPKLYASGGGVGLTNAFTEKPWRPLSLLLEADPPAHTPRRSLVFRILSGDSAARLRTGFEQVACDLFDRVLPRGRVDAVTDIAQPYILKAFPDAVGLSEAGRENLLPYGAMVFNGFGPRNALFEQSLADVEPRVPWIMGSCQRENLRPGGLGDQVYQGADAGEVTHDEALLLVRSFLSAGLDTTVDAVGSMLYLFAQHPDQWSKLRANPSLVKNAIEEVLRMEAPLQTMFRTTLEPTTLAGVAIAKNQKVMLSMGAINRDPLRWERSDEFDIERRTAGHGGFGAGIHGCIGQHVARLELEVFLTEAIRRVESIALTGPVEPKLNNALRGFASVPIALKAT
jgi:4-methoxybenzoate monooxygenase (O-demethylating)